MKHDTSDLVVSEMEKNLMLALRYSSPASSIYTIARVTNRKWQEIADVIKPYDEALSRKELNVDRLRDQGKRLLTSLGYYTEDGTFDMSKIPPSPAAPQEAKQDPVKDNAVENHERFPVMKAHAHTVDTPDKDNTQQAPDLFDFRSIAHHWLDGIASGAAVIDSFGFCCDPVKGKSVSIVLKAGR